MTMFEVNTDIGISHSKFSMPLNVVDDMKIAQPDPQFHPAERNFTEIYGNPRAGAARALCVDLPFPKTQ